MVADAELVLLLVAGQVEDIVDSAAVLAAELLGDLGELSHALLPVVELLDGAVVLVVAALSVGILDVRVDLLLPLGEGLLESLDEGDIGGAATVAKGRLLLVVERGEDDVGLEGLLGLHELLGELVEGVGELLLLLRFARLPLHRVHIVDEGLVDVVDEGLQHANGVFRDLTEEDVLITGRLLADRSVVLGVAKEVDSLSAELDMVA